MTVSIIAETTSKAAKIETWYFCESARGYYPYVPQCPEAWRLVPAMPPGAIR